MSPKLFMLVMNSSKFFHKYVENFVRNLRGRYREFFRHEKNLKKICCASDVQLGDEAYEVMKSISLSPNDNYREEQFNYMINNKEESKWELTGFPHIILEALSYLIGQFDSADMEVDLIISILKI